MKSPSGSSRLGDADLRLAEQARQAYERMMEQFSRVIIGQTDVLHQTLLALFAQGHCLIEGVPGLAKTLVISSLADLLSLNYRRIQFTPDLMPADITGTEILDEEEGTGKRQMRYVKGPVFANIILGDEINRAPPKTQAAMLQAMQEYKVTMAGVDYPLEKPFLVLGTQNPIEQEGTYPLPEAQLDRFMFKILIRYPTFAEELKIAEQTTGGPIPRLEPVLTREEILDYQRVTRNILVSPSNIEYAVRLVRATRPGTEEAKKVVGLDKYLAWGAGPRAYQALLLGAKANALLDGRVHVSSKDIRAVSKPVLRHRLVTSFAAESDGKDVDSVIADLIKSIPEPDSDV